MARRYARRYAPSPGWSPPVFMSVDVNASTTTEHLQLHHHPSGRRLFLLSLAALGVVYGDIGTSPLYTIRECFHAPHGLPLTPANVYGVLSLVFWALVTVVSIKYLVFIMRADNRGEGGILALMSLVQPQCPPGRTSLVLMLLGIFGAALLYGDGIITPAITVLSAIEGLTVATPIFEHWVVPLTIVILLALFAFQKYGTNRVGLVFGPVTLLWFTTLGVLGISNLRHHPSVLQALSPHWAIRVFIDNGPLAFVVLGAVFLAVTGGEALYADMGHFGRRPIRVAWFAIVLPCLFLNYLGQGALVLENPAAVENPFYFLAPRWFVIPLVILATAAAAIASQAMISGAFSLTRQAIQLGYSPRLDIHHTSEEEIGQIYIPFINIALAGGTIAVVLGFRTSTSLAAAYGIAVSLTMVITTILAFFAGHYLWKWSLGRSLLLSGVFLTIDLAFLSANVIKIGDGGWLPLVVGGLVFALMATWWRGRKLLSDQLREEQLGMDFFLEDVQRRCPTRVPGTAVFMTGSAEGTPRSLLHHFKHNKILHERVVFLTISTMEMPYVSARNRLTVQSLGNGFFRVIGRFGFMETPNVPRLLGAAKTEGLEIELGDTSFFLGRETLIPSHRRGMAFWRKVLFAFMAKNALPATAFFGIPPGRVVELGLQVRL